MKTRTAKAIAIGSRIASRREQMEYTQAELAVKIGVTSSAVAQYETGWTTPALKNLEKIAVELQVSTAWLLTGDEPEAQVRAQTHKEQEMLALARSLPEQQQDAALAMLRGLVLALTKA